MVIKIQKVSPGVKNLSRWYQPLQQLTMETRYQQTPAIMAAAILVSVPRWSKRSSDNDTDDEENEDLLMHDEDTADKIVKIRMMNN